MEKLTKGYVVFMKASSGLTGYGNAQCVSGVCEPLGTVSLYGHNQHYKIYDIDRVVEYPDEHLVKIKQLQAKNKRLKVLLDEVLCEVAVSCTLKYDIKQALKGSE